MKTITAIPTRYSGVTFRSRNEARFAAWCDTWRIQWEYEPEGLQIGNVRYLPDFWLPEGKTLVEIKPALFMSETWKLDALAEALAPREDLYEYDEDERCQGITLWCGTMIREGFELIRLWKDLGWEDGGIRGTWCLKCGRPHFIGFGGYDCRWCGGWAGDHLLGDFRVPLPDNVVPGRSPSVL